MDANRTHAGSSSGKACRPPVHTLSGRDSASGEHARILIVDDDDVARLTLIRYLAAHGYQADGAASATEAAAAVAAQEYGLALLDLGLPGGDGVDLARRWRERLPMSLICITGHNKESDLVTGLELGADDCVVRPFSLREVLARTRAVMRRTGQLRQVPVIRGKHPRAYQFCGWNLNLNTRRLIGPDQRSVALTNAEFNLLVVFLSAPERIISRDELLASTRAFDDICDRAIDVQILRLRRKLKADPGNPTLLRTERGAGYFLDTEIETLWD